jgi:pyruvate kinase
MRTLASSSCPILRLNQLPVTGTNTKIVCTLGPATDKAEPIGLLVHHGMHVARLNFSHAGADYSYAEELYGLVRQAHGKHAVLAMGASTSLVEAGKLPLNLRAIMVDTKGPEIRTGPLPGNAEIMDIEVGAIVTLTTHDVSKEPEGTMSIHVDYMSIAKTVPVGGEVLLDDGLIALEVIEVDPAMEYVICKALNGGPIKKNKGVNLPGRELDLPALTDKDKRDLKWACEVGADFVAASFIRTASNVRSVVAFLDRCISDLPDTINGTKPLRPLVISKIESKEGLDNFDAILKESDAIMVARGDLGVEIPYSKVFAAQRMMVSKSNRAGKPVIVATQMMDSMQRNPRPTRAEVTVSKKWEWTAMKCSLSVHSIDSHIYSCVECICRMLVRPSWTEPTPSCFPAKLPLAGIRLKVSRPWRVSFGKRIKLSTSTILLNGTMRCTKPCRPCNKSSMLLQRRRCVPHKIWVPR